MKRPHFLARGCPLLAAIFLSACATTQPVVVRGAAYCRLAPELTWSTDDTKESITGIRTHNAKRRKVCGS